MKFLIDTHTFLWFISDTPQMSKTALGLLESEADILLSIASLWEIAIKHSLSKLELPEPFDIFVTHQIAENDIDILPVQISHLSEMILLPFHHKDPFDRLLIGQAIAEGLPVISADSVFDSYPVERHW